MNDGDFFGFSVANIGDFDKDGIVDIAVGAPGDDTGVTDAGAFYVMRLNRDGTVKGFAKIDRTQLIFTAASDNVGASLTSLGTLTETVSGIWRWASPAPTTAGRIAAD